MPATGTVQAVSELQVRTIHTVHLSKPTRPVNVYCSNPAIAPWNQRQRRQEAEGGRLPHCRVNFLPTKESSGPDKWDQRGKGGQDPERGCQTGTNGVHNGRSVHTQTVGNDSAHHRLQGTGSTSGRCVLSISERGRDV